MFSLLLLTLAVAAPPPVEINCEPNGCRDGIAVILIADKSGVPRSTCTGFLIGPQTMATDSHCLPDDMKKKGVDCKDRLTVIFPQIGRGLTTTVGCAEIEDFSDTSRKNVRLPADYAFFRLAEPVNHAVLEIDYRGFSEGMPVTVPTLKVTNDSGSKRKFEVLKCRAVQRSYFLPTVESDEAPMALLGDCEAYQGMSGSPVLDFAGKVRGLLSQVNTNYGASLSTAFFKPLLSGPVTRFVIATSFSCISVGAQSRVLPADCGHYEWSAPPNVPFERLLKPGDLKSAIDLVMKIDVTKLDPRFRWEPLRLEAPKSEGVKALLTPKYTYHPTCRVGPESPAPGPAHPALLPMFEVVYSFNEYLQSRFLIRKLEPLSSEKIKAIYTRPLEPCS